MTDPLEELRNYAMRILGDILCNIALANIPLGLIPYIYIYLTHIPYEYLYLIYTRHIPYINPTGRAELLPVENLESK